MSRFKTGDRIEDAIKHRDRRELEWALEYAQYRVRIATMKQHEKGWRSTLERVQEALDSLREEAPNQPPEPTRTVAPRVRTAGVRSTWPLHSKKTARAEVRVSHL